MSETLIGKLSHELASLAFDLTGELCNTRCYRCLSGLCVSRIEPYDPLAQEEMNQEARKDEDGQGELLVQIGQEDLEETVTRMLDREVLFQKMREHLHATLDLKLRGVRLVMGLP